MHMLLEMLGKVGQRLKCRQIARPMNVCPIDFGALTLGLARSLAETGSSIETRFFAGRSVRLEQVGQCLEC